MHRKARRLKMICKQPAEHKLLAESELCILLDTFMYLNYHEAKEGQALTSILQDLAGHPDYREGGSYHGEYTILQQAAAEYPQLGRLRISCQSWQGNYDPGTNACTFEDKQGTYYIVYRGTGDGEWMDNAVGLSAKVTNQQKQALQYYNDVVNEKSLKDSRRVVITGHSKGGNKAQFVTMEEKQSLISRCYSIDGQGFSPEAINCWQQQYTPAEYQDRIHKLYGIAGENDYVHVLGRSLIPDDQMRYVSTPAAGMNLAGYHDIKYLYAGRNDRGEVNFSGERNPYVMKQGALAAYASDLSGKIMLLSAERRLGCAMSMMQVMELGGERKWGLNGEKMHLNDFYAFLTFGLPTIAVSLLGQSRKTDLLKLISGKVAPEGRLLVDTQELQAAGRHLIQIRNKMQALINEAEQIKKEMRKSVKGNTGIDRKLTRIMNDMIFALTYINGLSHLLQEIIICYQQCEAG